MRRTRKWSYVAQEAMRLADLGLTPGQIAKKLEVQRSTVQRWMAAGKLTDTRRSARGADKVPGVSPGEWAASVRAAYALDATDEELVRMAEAALRKVHDVTETAQVQLSAMGRFIAIVKQLSLPTRNPEGKTEPAEAPKAPERPAVVRRRAVGADPRTFLQAVK